MMVIAIAIGKLDTATFHFDHIATKDLKNVEAADKFDGTVLIKLILMKNI